jgi:conjugative transfer signal peptidase TraF
MNPRTVLIGLALALVAELGPALTTPAIGWPKLLLWNASASVPTGLYLLRPSTSLRVGELVAVTPLAPLARFMAARSYLPLGMPLLKHVGALGGQTVCRSARTVTINGTVVATALGHDSHGQPLPVWQGCHTLHAGEVFLLNRTAMASFDGRYFGVLPVATVTARAVPLWTFKEP